MSSFHFSLSAARNLSSFQLLPTSLMTDLLHLFLGLPVFLLPWGFHSRAAFGISPSSFLSVWPIHLSFLYLISKFISSRPVTLHKSLLQMTFGHHIVKMYSLVYRYQRYGRRQHAFSSAKLVPHYPAFFIGYFDSTGWWPNAAETCSISSFIIKYVIYLCV